MASNGYDPAYAKARYKAIDDQIKGLRAQIKDLTAQRNAYKTSDESPEESAPED